VAGNGNYFGVFYSLAIPLKPDEDHKTSTDKALMYVYIAVEYPVHVITKYRWIKRGCMEVSRI
jgi:hypothetical protein